MAEGGQQVWTIKLEKKKISIHFHDSFACILSFLVP